MELIRIAFNRIIGRPYRSLLIMTGVAVGVFSIAVINGVSTGGREVIATQLDTMGLYGMSIKFDQENDYYFTDSDVQKIIANVDGIEAITPVSADYRSVSVADETSGCVIWGVNENADSAMNLNVSYGKMFTQQDCTECLNVCIVTEDFAYKYFSSPADAVSRKIYIHYPSGQKEFTICGVIKAGSGQLSSVLSEYVPSFVYVPNESNTAIVGKNTVKRLALKASPGYDETSVAKKVVRYLNIEYNGFGDIQIENLNEKKDSFDSIMSTLTSMLSAIGSVSLFVSGISIMTVMMITVKERTREIGIKKSIGAYDGHIIAEFLAESAIISGFGSLAGIVLASGALSLAAKILLIEISVPVTEYAKTCILAISVGIVFSLVPAISAARLDPVVALKG